MTDCNGYPGDPNAKVSVAKCGCLCWCHADENAPWWPGPCAACCEPGMDCDCGRALAHLVEGPDEGLVG